MQLADEVGIALLIVLDTLGPAERLAFVLHDMFDVPFDDIAAMLDKTPAATRQLASRARRRVRGVPAPEADLPRRRRAVDAYLAATRGGDFDALVALLHPDVVLSADAAVVPTPEPVTVSGMEQVARGAMASMARARSAAVVLVDGMVGMAMAENGRLRVVLRFDFAADGRITGIDVIAEPARLNELDITGHRLSSYTSRRQKKVSAMRVLLKATLDTEKSNEVIRSGRMEALIKETVDRIGPEAAYFGTIDGRRTALLVFDMQDSSQMPPIGEPFLMELNAEVDLCPIMNGDDLAKGLSQLG